MLLSMTGHGEARARDAGVAIAVELRTVNNRYFKLSARLGDGFDAWEPRIESIVRERVRRGTVQISVRVDQEVAPDRYRLNAAVLAGYRRQLEDLAGGEYAPRWESLLALPGAVIEHVSEPSELEATWALAEKTLGEALTNLDLMRREEGRAMEADLVANCQAIAEQLEQISGRAPIVAEAYRTRLTERLNKLLAEYDRQIEPADIVREVGSFAERSDISEEIVRLRSHLDQFQGFMGLAESSGRKLDFLTQEMFRETNTIGSKANDAVIAGHVVEIKARIERMREMIQNVE